MSDDSSSSPEFGRIYYIRQSVRKTFQLILYSSGSELPTFSSSTSSSASSNKSKKKNPGHRPCLCWNINNGIVTVLLMTSFEGINPMAKINNDEWMIPNIPNEDLQKHLVSIHPTPSIPGRRTIQIQNRLSTEKLTQHEDNSFLILIPVVAKANTKWSRPFNGTFSADHLRYITELLAELDNEKREQMILNFSCKKNDQSCSTDSTTPQTRNVNITTIENDQKLSDDSGSDSSEGSGSLFVCRMNMVKHDMVKHDMVHNWLHQCIDNNLNYCSIETMATIDDGCFLAQSSDIMDSDTKSFE